MPRMLLSCIVSALQFNMHLAEDRRVARRRTAETTSGLQVQNQVQGCAGGEHVERVQRRRILLCEH